jgi:LacI family transcriptional regulator
MRDVAALAGVGTMTVSRVINGSAHVTEDTRSRVFYCDRSAQVLA